jgi:hypothetical protein
MLATRRAFRSIRALDSPTDPLRGYPEVPRSWSHSGPRKIRGLWPVVVLAILGILIPRRHGVSLPRSRGGSAKRIRPGVYAGWTGAPAPLVPSAPFRDRPAFRDTGEARIPNVGWDKLASGERRPTIRLAMVGLRSLRELVPPYLETGRSLNGAGHFPSRFGTRALAIGQPNDLTSNRACRAAAIPVYSCVRLTGRFRCGDVGCTSLVTLAG